MKLKFVDTNIFLEALVRTGARSNKAREFLKNGADLWTTDLVVVETEWVMRSAYQFSKEHTISVLKRILNISGLEITNKKLLTEALAIFEKTNVDFTDCLNVAIAKNTEISDFYSFDRDFDKFPGIKRREP